MYMVCIPDSLMWKKNTNNSDKSKTAPGIWPVTACITPAEKSILYIIQDFSLLPPKSQIRNFQATINSCMTKTHGVLLQRSPLTDIELLISHKISLG